MAIQYENLDEVTRGLMIEEIDRDLGPPDSLYRGSYLSERGKQDWPALLREAASNYNDDWLAAQLRFQNRLLHQTPRKKPKGGFTMVDVPVTAHITLSEGEFNRFYIRAVCRRALSPGAYKVMVYRGRHSDEPRPESETMIGTFKDAQKLLNDLRESYKVDEVFGLPKPNSGLSIKLA
jgi:hypothetical protein